ncbi:hypothetical protein IMZ48_19030 [Candidatus Bathyarchaeota archaeon]|nr:hypothetical protein [Candidatus Bathyarchaeota archaeon]
MRDLKVVKERIEASKQAGQQGAVSRPVQAQAPAATHAPISQTPVPVPVIPGASGVKRQPSQSQSPLIQRKGSQQSPANQHVAPVPDMGAGVPQARPKSSSPLLNKKTPSSGAPTPVPRPSPHVNGAGKPGAKASPARAAVPAPVPTPKPVPTPATSPPVTSMPAMAPAPAPPVTAAPVPMMDASQGSEFLNLPATSGGDTLNFTDMKFTIAQGDEGNQGPSHSMDLPGRNPEIIDIDSLFDTAGASGGEQSGAPTASMGLDNGTGPGQQSSGALDDIYDLGGGTNEEMDLDFELDHGGGGGGDSYIDDLLFGTGDGSLGELDESSLG